MNVDNELAAQVTAGKEAQDFTRDTFVFDALSLFYVLDDRYAERCLAGGVNAANVTFFHEGKGWEDVLRQIDTGLGKIDKSPYLMLAKNSADLDAAKAAGKLAVIVGSQGSDALEDQPWRVRLLHRLGFRIFGLAYTGATMFADGCGERRDAGVSVLGQELIEEVNALNLILDLSHCGHRTRAEATALATFPTCTHSNAYAVNANDRNTKDETAKAIAAKEGIVGVCGLPRSVWPTSSPTLSQLLDHLDHWTTTVGFDHTGIGFDFIEGFVDSRKENSGTAHKPPKWRVLRPDIFGTTEDFFTDSYPVGMHSIRLLPNFTQGMMDRQYSKEQMAAILGGNWRRLFAAANG